MSVRRALIGSLIAITFLAFPVQVIMDPSMVNAAAACMVTASSLVMLFYIAWSRAIHTHPLSTFALFGFCGTTQMGALLVQTMAWTPISAFLYDPLHTFGMLAFFQAIALAVHVVYRFFSVSQRSNGGPIRQLFGRLGLYQVPPAPALWFMGLVGFSAFLAVHFQGVVGKIAMGFVFLLWAPFLIPLYLREYGDTYCGGRLHKGLLVVYALSAAVVGLAMNTRAIMFSGVATIGALYLLAGMRSHVPVTSRAIGRLAMLAIVLLVAARPLSHIATSMAIARQWRGKVDAVEMVKTTFFVLGKPNLIEAYREQGEVASRFGVYDERYVANPFLNRFVSTKYYDNAFHFGASITSDAARRRLADFSIQMAWAGLPAPLLAKLGIPVDKDGLHYSMGDYMLYLSRGVPLGGFTIGSMLAQGMVLFGPLFPFVYGLICWLLFGLMDLLTVRSVGGKVMLSTLGMLQIWNYFLGGISFEGLHLVVYLLFRNFEQLVLIYVFVFGVTRVLAMYLRAPAAATALPTWQQG